MTEEQRIKVEFKGVPSDHELRNLADDLFAKIDTSRLYEDDYEVTIKFIRDVYNAGRARGAYETSAGERC